MFGPRGWRIKAYRDRTFRQVFDRGSGAAWGDLELVRCTFDNCGLSLTQSVPAMTHVRGVTAAGCRVVNCHVGPAVFEDVLIDKLLIDDMLVLNAPLFRRVTLRGDIGRLLINRNAAIAHHDAEAQLAFDAARAAFYAGGEWALDISGARFLEFEADGVPAQLVRRDPETQVVVTRARASQPGWRERLTPENKFWPFVIDQFLGSGDADIVLAAPKRARRGEYTSLLAGLNELRRLGVTDPD